MCTLGQSLIFDVFVQNAFDLKVSSGYTLIHYVAKSLEISSKCFKIEETIIVVFVTLGSDERLDNGGLVKIHTRPFHPNHWYKLIKSSYLRPLPAIFSAMLCFIGLSAWPGLYSFPRKESDDGCQDISRLAGCTVQTCLLGGSTLRCSPLPLKYL